MLSQTATYALQATLCLAEANEDRMRVDDIVERLDIPRNYLSKILHSLARGGVLTSTRGPGGGFSLARPPEEISLSDVIRTFDDIDGASGCVLGRPQCSDADPCAAHHRWRAVAASVRVFFDQTSLADL